MRRSRGLRAGTPLALTGAALAAIGLAACGGSTAGLIPGPNALALRHDFEAVSQAALSGSCPRTEAALAQTQTDFGALPVGIKGVLHQRLQQGIANLHERALAKCQEATTTTTSTTTTRQTTSQQTEAVTTTTTTPPPVTSPPVTTTTPSEAANGGAAAPQENGEGGAEAGGEGGAEAGGGAGGPGGAGGR